MQEEVQRNSKRKQKEAVSVLPATDDVMIELRPQEILSKTYQHLTPLRTDMSEGTFGSNITPGIEEVNLLMLLGGE